MTPRPLEVAAGATRYPIVLCEDVAAALLAHLREAAPDRACCVISDDRVAQLYGRPLASALKAADVKTTLLDFRVGEASKTRTTWASLTDAMLDARLGRDTIVVAVGGGVTADLAGFVAATYMRGVPVVQVPTSLVAMVDAAIGGKTGLDVPAGKNLVGAFHPPSAVIVDAGMLRTLPAAHAREGLVEALKHGAIADVDYFEWILARARALARDGGLEGEDARWLVERSVRLKSRVVSADPLEQGIRAILNFGHTVAHALEAASGYAITHGQAVARGMVAEARIGEELGVTEAGTAERIADAVAALELPPLPAFDPAAVVAIAAADKKNRRGRVRCSLIRRIGESARAQDGAWTHAISIALLESSLA